MATEILVNATRSNGSCGFQWCPTPSIPYEFDNLLSYAGAALTGANDAPSGNTHNINLTGNSFSLGQVFCCTLGTGSGISRKFKVTVIS